MQHLSKTLQQSGASEQPTVKPLSENTMELFWMRMTEIYGHKWVSNYGESDESGTWAKGLADLSTDALKQGFKACMADGHEWPPSLPEFRKLCKPKRENAAMYRISPNRQLPKKLADDEREKRSGEISAMIAKIKLSTPSEKRGTVTAPPNEVDVRHLQARCDHAWSEPRGNEIDRGWYFSHCLICGLSGGRVGI